MNEARSKPRVLLVDDCAQNREMYAEYLSPDFDVREAGDGREAIEQARAVSPQVIVMDLGLPGMSGTEAIERLREDERTKRIPIVIVSGIEEPPLGFESAGEWGAFVRKPCRPAALVEIIRRMLERGAAGGEPAPS